MTDKPGTDHETIGQDTPADRIVTLADKLTHDERVRLESLAQANATLASSAGRLPPVPAGKTIGDAVLIEAAKYERFLLGLE